MSHLTFFTVGSGNCSTAILPTESYLIVFVVIAILLYLPVHIIYPQSLDTFRLEIWISYFILLVPHSDIITTSICAIIVDIIWYCLCKS